MQKYSYIFFILITVILVLDPIICLSQSNMTPNESGSYTLQVIKSSPSNFEINNGTVLYSKSINTFTKDGTQFAAEHQQLADATIAEIDKLKLKLATTRQLNQSYTDQLAVQLELWKGVANKNPSLAPILSRETQVFNLGISLQMQENTKWAVIDSVLSQIDQLNKQDPTRINQSFTKSSLYSDLLLYYVDLIEFYKIKYKDLITTSTLYHAAQENPNAKVPGNILQEIKPKHQKELELAKSLLSDLAANLENIQSVATKTQELKAFYKKLDKYSLSEVNNIIKNLQMQADSLKANQFNMLANADIMPVINGYIGYYQSVKQQLQESQISSEIEEAVLLSMYEKQLTKIALSTMIHPELVYLTTNNWTTDILNTVKSRTKLVSSPTYNISDYINNKASADIFALADKDSTAYNKKLFTDEYQKWSNTYNSVGDKVDISTIKNTFVDPLIANSAHNDSTAYKQFDDYLAQKKSTNMTSQSILNSVTCANSGLVRDLASINNIYSAPESKMIAGTGVILAAAPALSSVRINNQNTQNSINTLAQSVASVSGNIKQSPLFNSLADNIVRQATTSLITATDAYVRNDDRANIANGIDETIRNDTSAQINYDKAKYNLNATVMNNVIKVPDTVFTDKVASTVKTFLSDQTMNSVNMRFKNLYQHSLTNVIKNAEPFFSASVASTLGIKDLTSFTLTNFVNSNVSSGINRVLDNVRSGKNVSYTNQNQPPIVSIPYIPPQQTYVTNPSNVVSPSYAPQMPVAPPQSAYVPPPNNMAAIQYLQQQRQQQAQNIRSAATSQEIDQLISQHQQNQQQFNQQRGPGNANNTNNYIPYNNPNNFSTDLRSNQPGGATAAQNIQNLSQQTAQWHQQNEIAHQQSSQWHQPNTNPQQQNTYGHPTTSNTYTPGIPTTTVPSITSIPGTNYTTPPQPNNYNGYYSGSLSGSGCSGTINFTVRDGNVIGSASVNYLGDPYTVPWNGTVQPNGDLSGQVDPNSVSALAAIFGNINGRISNNRGSGNWSGGGAYTGGGQQTNVSGTWEASTNTKK